MGCINHETDYICFIFDNLITLIFSLLKNDANHKQSTATRFLPLTNEIFEVSCRFFLISRFEYISQFS